MDQGQDQLLSHVGGRFLVFPGLISRFEFRYRLNMYGVLGEGNLKLGRSATFMTGRPVDDAR
jgi:hypothetical protein